MAGTDFAEVFGLFFQELIRMSQTKYLVAGLMLLGVSGYTFAEQDAEAAKAECQAMAEDQGVSDIEAYVAKCVQDKTAQPNQ